MAEMRPDKGAMSNRERHCDRCRCLSLYLVLAVNIQPLPSKGPAFYFLHSSPLARRPFRTAYPFPNLHSLSYRWRLWRRSSIFSRRLTGFPLHRFLTAVFSLLDLRPWKVSTFLRTENTDFNNTSDDLPSIKKILLSRLELLGRTYMSKLSRD